jgi:DNA-binding NtrC family response regulator
LVVYHRDGAEIATLLPGEAIIIGRVPPADLVVPDSSLSRLHARVRLLEGEVLIEDLGSTNGTWINGESVTAGTLRAGQAAIFGAVTAVVQTVGGEPRLGLEGHVLRVLETKTITRVGSTKEQPIDVRIDAASHRHLETTVEHGEFREDLLYRLNAVILEIPPLRARRGDIPLLAEHFLASANESNGTHLSSIAADVLEALKRYNWPGNIRELRNAIERAVVVAEHDVVTLRDLPLPRRVRELNEVMPISDDGLHVAPPSAGASLRLAGEGFRACMERLEIHVIREAIEEAGGNQSEAARQLDMPRRTLVHKVRVLGVNRTD